MVEATSVLALLVATGALYAALKPRKVEPGATEKAFRRLESDVEGLFEKVESHLGRISRLKRATSPLPVEPAAVAVPGNRLSRAGLYAKARRQYADKDRHGVGEQRRG